VTAPEVLEQNALFKGFTEIGLKLFAGIAEEKSYPAGAPLFVEGMVGESLIIVKSGAVRLSQKVDGVEKELAVVGPGEHLGGLALLSRTVRLVTAVAATPCEVVEIAHRDFVRLQPEKPQACLKLALSIGADLAARMSENRDALQRLAAGR
jgi:CRP/FNR family cyclic AMP-dependent transcriptional regulator